MSVNHPDEATLLRSVVGELPEPRWADVRRHVARCRPCLAASAATKRLHERLSGAGDSLAFSMGDAFVGRPVSRPLGRAERGLAAKEIAVALGRLESEKERLLAAIESNAGKAVLVLDPDDSACRLAVAHLLEEAVASDPSERFAEFAAEVVGRDLSGGEAEAVLPGAQLRVLARLVLGNWRLFCGLAEKSGVEFGAAWAELGAFDAPEHLCAWVEVGESLRRSYQGRAIEGRLLAERALETFERYGLERGIVRARNARAVALYTSSEFREAHREFRACIGSRSATSLDRARGVSGAAFSLAARGRFHDAAKEYSRVRRRLRGEGAQVEQYLLQAEMKAALGTAGRWHQRADGLAAFALPEAGGAFHAREIAAEIVKTVSENKENGLEKARALLGKIGSDPSRGHAYLYACQLAMPKVPTDPVKFLGFANAATELPKCLPYLRDKGPAQPVCLGQVLGEAALVESSALNFLGRAEEAQASASGARIRFLAAGEDSFALALVDFFEGSAATFAGRFALSLKLLKGARSEFQLYGQENWQGRAEAALGLLLLGRGKCAAALHFYDGALRLLHPEQDGAAYAITFVNRGYLLVKVGRLDAAKVAYARGLSHVRRLGLTIPLFNVRFGLATIDLLKGSVVRALCGFERMAEDASRLELEEQVLGARLRVAECMSKLGRSDEVGECLEAIRQSAYNASLSNDLALGELFEISKERGTSSELIAYIADYFDGRNRGVQTPYRPFRLVAKGR